MTCTSTPSERALARNHVYATLSRLFLAPGEGLDEALSTGALFDELADALADIGDAGDLAGPVDALRRAWADTPADDPPDARTRYHRVFGHALSPDYPPYETQYGLAHPFEQSERLATIAGFYRSFGLQLSLKLRDRLDHFAVELEFMGFLAAKEAFHIESGEDLHLDACRAGARHFLEYHVGPALISFAERLARRGPDGFYKEVARFAAAFVVHEATRAGVGARLANPLELVPWDDAALDAAVGEVL